MTGSVVVVGVGVGGSVVGGGAVGVPVLVPVLVAVGVPVLVPVGVPVLVPVGVPVLVPVDVVVPVGVLVLVPVFVLVGGVLVGAAAQSAPVSATYVPGPYAELRSMYAPTVWPPTFLDPKVTVPIAFLPASEPRVAVWPGWKVLPFAVVIRLLPEHLAETVMVPPLASLNVPDPAVALPENSYPYGSWYFPVVHPCA